MNDEARISLPTCLTNMFLWLQVHFMYALFIECVLFEFIVLAMMIYDLLSRKRIEDRRRLFNNLLNGNIASGQRSHCRSHMMTRQIALIIVYISAAFFYTRIRYRNNLEVITLMTVLRWLIEASLGPSFVLFLMDMFDLFPQFIVYNRPERLFSNLILHQKILLFAVMRYVKHILHLLYKVFIHFSLRSCVTLTFGYHMTNRPTRGDFNDHLSLVWSAGFFIHMLYVLMNSK